MFGLKNRRRRNLARRPFPPEWLAIIERNVPYYHCLPAELQTELQGLIQILLAEKHFEGAGGLAMADEIRVTIAAQACILLLGRKTDFYPKLESIIVYPHAYVASSKRSIPGGAVAEEQTMRAGESWGSGAIVFSWLDVARGARYTGDGRNVVFHEFAHQLDAEEGTTDGAPPLPDQAMYPDWKRVLSAEYDALVDSVDHRRRTFLDPYAATSPAEFFAVITEFFFEKPRELRLHNRQLYDQLSMFYRQDPASWSECQPRQSPL